MRASFASEQTYRQLTDALQRGVYGPGARLPAERTLAAQYGVSRETLRNALNRLADEHLVESVVGSGWFVAPEVVGEPPSVLQTFTEMARARGLRPTAHVLRRRVRTATLPEADQLRIPPGADVLDLVRLRGMERTTICLDETVMPLDLAAPLQDADLEDRSLYEELETRCDVRVHRSVYSVRAEVADTYLAAQLGVTAGWPVLVGEEVGYTDAGRPVLVGATRYRGDAYRFQADLFRPV
ncbi:GntR family transcriptional regulator [Microlunatus antarcticus]|uniref:GntR family transcriptional regulator n=1 Tax=Microlunatus antarcticus TaxID=53388 RepID=A0A7W5P5Q2_9ACTN|nr:GntR family transcriptional regulator [Microlunatus antarcticus]MBB3325715.1 GntR family transcriptional regulator [Microlunatus antarcticus]